MKGLLVLAIDGLDWPMLLAAHAAGRLPHFSRLLGRGVQTRLTFPPQAAAFVAARWTSLACGTGPAQHGIANDLLCRADGLRLAPPTAADLRATPLWQHAWQAGLDARVVGWPATADSPIPASAGRGSWCVADGFQRQEAGVQRAWPLSPTAVAAAGTPTAARALVRAARMHPTEVTEAMLAALLPPDAGLASDALREATATLLARWASVHNLGVHACEEGTAQLVMLRFDGLPAWRRSAATNGAATDGAMGVAEAGWLVWLDLMLGRYAASLADSSHLMLLADQGREVNIDGGTAGGMLLSGPDARRQTVLCDGPATVPATRALDIALDLLGLLGLLGLSHPARLEEPDPAEAPDLAAQLRAAPLCDDVALRWLHAQGVAPADLAPLRQRALAVCGATLVSLAADGLGAA